jgi:hypothetical protein
MKALFTLLLGIACCSVLPCEAKSHEKKSHQPKKVYVDPHNVRITKDGIFVLEKGHLKPVTTLSRDAKGVFVAKMHWRECYNCDRLFDADRWDDECPYCGFLN